MNNFLSDLNSIYWWVSVVLVGFLINLLGNTVSKTMDNVYSKYSQKRFAKKESLEKAFEEEIINLLANKHEQLMTIAKETNIRSLALDNGIKAVLFIAMGMGISPMQSMDSTPKADLLISLVLMLFGLVFVILSFSHNSKAHKLNYLLAEVNRRQETKV